MIRIMPKLAAFPKAFMQQLCKEGSMSVSDWIRLAAPLEVQGLEWYAGFLEMADERNWQRFRQEVEGYGEGDSDDVLFAGFHPS
jgi:hypothetical protein